MITSKIRQSKQTKWNNKHERKKREKTPKKKTCMLDFHGCGGTREITAAWICFLRKLSTLTDKCDVVASSYSSTKLQTEVNNSKCLGGAAFWPVMGCWGDLNVVYFDQWQNAGVTWWWCILTSDGMLMWPVFWPVMECWGDLMVLYFDQWWNADATCILTSDGMLGWLDGGVFWPVTECWCDLYVWPVMECWGDLMVVYFD